MEKQHHKSSQTIDQILAAHLRKQQAENQLRPGFSSILMDKLVAKEEKPGTSPGFAFASRSLFIPAFLLCLVILSAFGYYLADTELILYQKIEIAFDSSFFQQKGFQYSVFSLIALLGFSLFDHFFQLKRQRFSK